MHDHSTPRGIHRPILLGLLALGLAIMSISLLIGTGSLRWPLHPTTPLTQPALIAVAANQGWQDTESYQWRPNALSARVLGTGD